MRKTLFCLILSSMFVISGCSGYIVNALTNKHKNPNKMPVKTITVTLNKTNPEYVISVLGKPNRTDNKVYDKYVEKELDYYASDDGYLLNVTVCNENNQCASNGKKTRVTFKFKNNKFVSLWENYHL